MKTNLFSLAFNSARRIAGVLFSVAANVDAVAISDDKDGWRLLAPYGDTSYWHEEKKDDWKKYTQSFQRPQADSMVAAFNSVAMKRGANFKGLPIYSGHPDVDPVRWPDERRFGSVNGLEARADGIYANVAWNSLGKENCREGFLVYPSPAWDYDTKKAKASGVIAPDELRSVGLTNTPRIQDVPAWVNSDDPDAPEDASQSQSNSNNAPSMKTPPDFKSMLAQHLGVPADTSDDDLQKAHDAAMGAKATKAAADAKAHTDKAAADQKVEELKAKVANAETATAAAKADAEKFRQVAVNAQLDGALTAGKITAAERTEFETAFNADFDGTSTKLAGKSVALNTKTLGLQPGAVGVDLANPESRRLAFNSRVDALMRANKYGIDAALRDMRSNPEDAALLKAMEPAKPPDLRSPQKPTTQPPLHYV